MSRRIQNKTSRIKGNFLAIFILYIIPHAAYAADGSPDGFSFVTPEFPGEISAAPDLSNGSKSGASASRRGVQGSIQGSIPGEDGNYSGGSDSAYGVVPGSDSAMEAGRKDGSRYSYAASGYSYAAGGARLGTSSPCCGGASSIASSTGNRGVPGSESYSALSSDAMYGTLSSDAMLSSEAWSQGYTSSSGGAAGSGRYTTMLDASGNAVRVQLSADGKTATFDNGYTISVDPNSGNAFYAGIDGVSNYTNNTAILPVQGMDYQGFQYQSLVRALIASFHSLKQSEGNAGRVDEYLSMVKSMATFPTMILEKNFSPKTNKLAKEHLDVLISLRLTKDYFDAIDAVEQANIGDGGSASPVQEARVKQLADIVLPAQKRNTEIIYELAKIAGISVQDEFANIDAMYASSHISSSAARFANGRSPSLPEPIVTVDPENGKTTTTFPPYSVDSILVTQQEIARRMLVVWIEMQSHLNKGDRVLPMLLDQIKGETDAMISLNVSNSLNVLSMKQQKTLLVTKAHVDQGAAITQSEYSAIASDINAQLVAAKLNPEQEVQDYIASGGSAAAAAYAEGCNPLTAIAKPWLCATGGLF